MLEELKLKKGADGRDRTLYSWRHFYATQDLERGVSTHALSKQMGNSTAMLDKHYSKYSPMLNADLHSGRASKKAKPTKPSSASPSAADLAFDMLAQGKIETQALLTALGVHKDNYEVTETITIRALQAKNAEHIDDETLLKILSSK